MAARGFGVIHDTAIIRRVEPINMGNATPARTDFDQIDNRDVKRQPAAFFEAVHPRDFEFGGHQRCKIMDQARLGRRAPHVE